MATASPSWSLALEGSSAMIQGLSGGKCSKRVSAGCSCSGLSAEGDEVSQKGGSASRRKLSINSITLLVLCTCSKFNY